MESYDGLKTLVIGVSEMDLCNPAAMQGYRIHSYVFPVFCIEEFNRLYLLSMAASISSQLFGRSSSISILLCLDLIQYAAVTT